MTKDEILRDLRQAYGPKVILSPEDLALAIGRSPKAQANMRSRGASPMPVKRLGGKVGGSVYDLADYLAGDSASAFPGVSTPATSVAVGRTADAPSGASKKARFGAAKAQPQVPHAPKPWLPARSRKSLGPALLGFRELLNFWGAVHAELEAAEIASALAGKPRARSKPTSA